MLIYVPQTSTRKTIAAMRARGWRFLLSPKAGRNVRGLPYAIDNGAWTGFDPVGFAKLLADRARNADWIVLPDIVGGGMASLDLSLEWLSAVGEYGRPMLLAVQNGMQVDTIAALLKEHTSMGVFVGGDTEWKERTMFDWGRLCAGLNRIMHVGRVNSQRRLSLAWQAGAASVDGSGIVKFPDEMIQRFDRGLDKHTRQGCLIL